MRGKETCRMLKVLRQAIAEENDIVFNTSECSFEGECMGFCEKCDAEIRYLEKELQKKMLAGQSIQLSKLAHPSLLDEFEEALGEDDETYAYDGDLFYGGDV